MPIAALRDPANETLIVARARDALAAAAARAESLGYAVTGLGDQRQAEARHLGAIHAALARRLAADGSRRAIISGGEATVTGAVFFTSRFGDKMLRSQVIIWGGALAGSVIAGFIADHMGWRAS